MRVHVLVCVGVCDVYCNVIDNIEVHVLMKRFRRQLIFEKGAN